MDHFSSSVQKTFHVLLKSWGAIIFNFQWVALENASLKVYVGMMDDYGRCPMVIEHIAFNYYFFLGKLGMHVLVSLYFLDVFLFSSKSPSNVT